MRNAAALRATFSETIDLINKGRSDEAETICRQTVGQNPDDANMVALLGAILVKKRQFPEAEIDGLEAFLNWRPADEWDITANLGINNAELSKSGTLEVQGAPIDRSAEEGTPLAPDWKASLSIDR